MIRPTNNEINEFVTTRSFGKYKLNSQNTDYQKISIVIPSYNQGRFLEQSILSVLNQNYPNLECLVIDGGSIDNSKEILKKYDSYLTYWVSEPDKGQSDALNKGYKIAQGELIGWINSDDFYLPGTLLKIARLFKQYHKIDVIYGNRLHVNEYNKVIGEVRYTPFSKLVLQYDDINMAPQSMLWKRHLFDKIGYFDTNCIFAMDYDFFLRAAQKETKFKFVREYFAAMRRYPLNRSDYYGNQNKFKDELYAIKKKYVKRKKITSLCKVCALFYRGIYYSLQGDIYYFLKLLIKGGIKRLMI